VLFGNKAADAKSVLAPVPVNPVVRSSPGGSKSKAKDRVGFTADPTRRGVDSVDREMTRHLEQYFVKPA
jgi:hypothetical protein